jgi:hypothetical protein
VVVVVEEAQVPVEVVVEVVVEEEEEVQNLKVMLRNHKKSSDV